MADVLRSDLLQKIQTSCKYSLYIVFKGRQCPGNERTHKTIQFLVQEASSPAEIPVVLENTLLHQLTSLSLMFTLEKGYLLAELYKIDKEQGFHTSKLAHAMKYFTKLAGTDFEVHQVLF
ncbi:hypothetical protein DPMN_071723 [Dreissena polymorpha]|uniref:Uncharacterized protein n=1 Tax=Dreissena polymorpha TaxID=45954 RepID=A0A9D3Z797_DREPO|nr:hypothetical protein DPMN_071723 [Dreissena polymorpha]